MTVRIVVERGTIRKIKLMALLVDACTSRDERARLRNDASSV